MPFAAMLYLASYVFEEHRLEQLAEMRADDDGMAQPYIRLEGITVPRMLSWAEERALRRDLQDWGAARLYLPTRIHAADESGHICADKLCGWSMLVLNHPKVNP